MNTIINSAFRTASIALATLLLVAVSFAIAPKAHATELDGWDTVGYYDMSSPTYDYGYDTGYSGMGSFTGGGFRGGSSLGGGYSYSTVYAPTNTNTCTAVNSCNSYWDDHSIFNAPTTIVTNNPAPQTVVYSQPTSYPVYQPVYTQPAPVYTPTYYPAQRPIAYNNTPYVTLAAVPYTGLELGPLGTALYWGFLVLWCLFAAYLIVVKKVHNKIVAWFTGGTEPKTLEQKSGLPASAVLAETGYPRTFEREFSVKSAPTLRFTGIDPFVLAQINRAK